MGKYVNLKPNGIVHCLITDKMLEHDFEEYLQELEALLPTLDKLRVLVDVSQTSRILNYQERKIFRNLFEKYLIKDNRQAVCGLKNAALLMVANTMITLSGKSQSNRFFKTISDGEKWLLE